MKNSQASIWEHPINNMEVVSGQIPAEQLVDIIQPALTSDLEIAACQQLIKILSRIAMAKSRRGKDHIH